MNKLSYKKIVYDFDLVSGKVNQVSYQPGKPDTYYHRYSYDAENRITDVFTGRDSVQLFLFPEREAHYTYYKHGPLFRTDIGQLKVQGQDFAYTLHGWIKGVNPVLGGTLTNGTDTTEAYPTAQDAYGYSLNYFRGDYKAIGYSAQATSILGALGTNAAPLYNGNISTMAVYTPKLGAAKVYNYHYDQLNRIVAMDVFNGLNPSAGTFVPISISDYRERVTYDPNGNIMTYNRHGDAARLSMDSMLYSYTAGTNRLHRVTDYATDASSGTYAQYNDLKQGQSDNNYQYDQIGNLIYDGSEDISNITWNVYGKIETVTKSGTEIRYVYDASGNRIIKKTPTDTTFYVRDASGNVLSVYSRPVAGTLQQAEIHLYGSSRIGMLTTRSAADTFFNLSGGFAKIKGIKFTRGEKLFELSNHLGNVLVAISDRKIAIQNGTTGLNSHYLADISSAQDYYPFGMCMPGRKYEAQSGYRYGFNGKEKGNELISSTYDFNARILDSRIGRWLSGDPASSAYPSLSPYCYVANSPLLFIDPTGKWIAKVDYDEKSKLYSLTFVAEKGDNLSTLALQLGIPKSSLLKVDPSLKSLKIKTGVELKLEKVKEVNNVNYAINSMMQNFSGISNGRMENCANFAVSASGAEEGLAPYVDNPDNVAILESRMIQKSNENFTANPSYSPILTDAKAKIGDLIYFRGSYLEDENADQDHHFVVVILKNKIGNRVSSVLQKNGTKPLVMAMADPENLINPYIPSAKYNRAKIEENGSSIFRPKKTVTHNFKEFNDNPVVPPNTNQTQDPKPPKNNGNLDKT